MPDIKRLEEKYKSKDSKIFFSALWFLALATLLVLRSIEYKKSRENSSFILTVITAVFLYVVVIYLHYIMLL